MSWPYTPSECARCRYFDAVDPSARDDAGYEIVGLCLHPLIAMELFRLRLRPEPSHCRCFLAAGQDQRVSGSVESGSITRDRLD
jgi:hypothetical protein